MIALCAEGAFSYGCAAPEVRELNCHNNKLASTTRASPMRIYKYMALFAHRKSGTTALRLSPINHHSHAALGTIRWT